MNILDTETASGCHRKKVPATRRNKNARERPPLLTSALVSQRMLWPARDKRAGPGSKRSNVATSYDLHSVWPLYAVPYAIRPAVWHDAYYHDIPFDVTPSGACPVQMAHVKRKKKKKVKSQWQLGSGIPVDPGGMGSLRVVIPGHVPRFLIQIRGRPRGVGLPVAFG